MAKKSAGEKEPAEPAPSAPAPERRIGARLSCEGMAEVVVPSRGFLFRGEISDITEFGCHIMTHARLNMRPRAEVELRFTINEELFSVTARVAVVRAGVGVGFEFSEVETQIYKNLLSLIEVLSLRDRTDAV